MNDDDIRRLKRWCVEQCLRYYWVGFGIGILVGLSLAFVVIAIKKGM